MFYLTTHSTHFYLRLYDHSDSEKGNPLLPHRLLFPINSKGSFICTIPHRITHTTALVTPVVEHWLEREIAQWVHPMKDRSDDPLHHERMFLPWNFRVRNSVWITSMLLPLYLTGLLKPSLQEFTNSRLFETSDAI